MHEYEILYQKWKRYRRKRLVFKSALFLLLLAISYGVYHFYKSSLNISKPKYETKQKSQNIILPNKNFETKLHAYKLKNHPKKPKTTKKREKNPTTHKFSSKKLLIESKTTTLTDLKAAFDAAPSAQKALLVAKRYYEKNAYKEAAKWAYKANTLDSSNEESWLLFAKALAKDGKKKKAITILKIYYKKSGSPKAKLLMRKIIEGELK